MQLREIKIGIWGLGLLGGSLAKALRARVAALAERGLALSKLTVYDASGTAVEMALAEAVADQGFVVSETTQKALQSEQLRESLAQLDVLYLALPMQKIADCAAQIAAASECLITDVGSVKAPLQKELGRLRFIGGHPMAGSERRGYSCAQAHLFENAVWVFCEDGAGVRFADRRLLLKLAEAMGAQALEMSSCEHDRAVALISHLPHVSAAALARRLALHDEAALWRLAAGGFKDITRIASGDPALWTGICEANRAALLAALDEMIADLSGFRALLESTETGAMEDFFARARDSRDRLPEGLAGGLSAPALLMVDVQDKPGELAHITRVLGAAGINIRNIGIQDARQYEGGVLRLYLADGSERLRAAGILEADGYACT